jgi:hypothetical protein
MRHMVIFFLAYSSTLEIDATYSSEASVGLQQATWCYISKDKTLDVHHCENSKSNT